jgi:hypothetical protein
VQWIMWVLSSAFYRAVGWQKVSDQGEGVVTVELQWRRLGDGNGEGEAMG